MTTPISLRVLLIGILSTLALAGCSAPAASEGDEQFQGDVPESNSVALNQAVSTACTTTRDASDPNYICYTTTCPETVTTECYPKPKKMRSWGTLSAQ